MSISDASLAAEIATKAGELLLKLREDYVGDLDQLRDAGDAQAQALIAQLLSEHRPSDLILSEEAVDDARRLSADRVWIIDPLDGTWEYGEGRWDWAVHIALWQKDAADITDAAIFLPATNQLFTTDQPPTVPVWPVVAPKIVISRTRPPKQIAQIQADVSELLVAQGLAPGLEVLEVGSAGAKTAALLTGDAQLYVHDGGLNEWDAAAPFAIAKAAGIIVKHFDGTAPKYNQANVKLPAIYLATPKMAEIFEQIKL